MKVKLDEHQTMNFLYEWGFLDKRNQYSLFLGGNHRKVVIRSTVNNGSKLLLVKDSYAHAIVPFLANHFEEIHMIDMRYFRESVKNCIDENDIKEVLFYIMLLIFQRIVI